MERIAEAAKALRLFPKLQLGEKTDKGVKATGPHTVKITAEPTTVMMNKQGKMVKSFKFIVEESGNLYKWLVPLVNEQNEGHYLIDRLNSMGIEVGEEVILEMKKRGPRNYIDITRPGESHEEEEIEIGDDEELDPTTINPF